ncbi:cache domain-containing protein [Vibrio hannami]|uniref:bifunctional diguanylate cyclase/phosphodiesterase n=1 Tax=Vibrio hannami TaxID=2717094 RepID=UPI00240F75FB|nr:cache domain-containing protein [Vibrio hannami]MDG3087914.1 cache domain-containing protein [Vibrio hannami]
MKNINDRKLLNLIRYAPVLIIGICVIAINIVVFQDNRNKATESIESLRNDLIERQQGLVSHHVNQAVKQIQFEKSRAVELLKKQAKSRVYEAHEIATNIYNNNRDKSKQEITKLISDALRPIRFFEGRGYFFVFQMDGINVMHGLKTQLEGKSAWGAKDVRGTFILREHIRLIKELGGEAFYNWWYQKPGEPVDAEFEKVGFGKRFEPYDWFIGTGEYVVDVENDIKKLMLNWASEFGYDEAGYVFIIDKSGEILASHGKARIGKFIDKTVSENGKLTVKAMEQATADGGGFVEYNASYKPGEIFDGEDVAPKISYVKAIEEWGWFVGSGFYTEEFEHYLAQKQLELVNNNQSEFIKITIISLIFTLMVMGVSLMAGNLIAQRFSKFQERISEDFGELEDTKDQMAYMAQHDALTGLPNRLMLVDVIREGIEYSRANGKQLAVMFVDLDDFKKVNDLYGHSSGDKLLETISRKFETILGARDTVSRFGGDEFIFCFPDLEDITAAERKVQDIKAVFQDQFVIDGKVLSTACSIGVSMYPEDSDSPDSLIRKADIVLYKSKAIKKGDVMFYDESINEQVQYDFVVEEELRRAIYKDEISVLYQPQMDADTGKMIGVEALARWSNVRLGMVSPVKFIAVAEETGLIHEIGLFVFRRACEDISLLSRNGDDALKVSVNISPKQLLNPDFSQYLEEIVRDVGIDISRVTLEITENVLLDDLNKVTPILMSLRNMGFGISLDDFGTGYSSLSYLNNLPISEIKIDRCFIDKLLVNEQSDSLVKAIIAIGDSCGMRVVAEGVETQEQYKTLMSYGCGYVQGYYFERPLPIQKISQWGGFQELA